MFGCAVTYFLARKYYTANVIPSTPPPSPPHHPLISAAISLLVVI